LAIGPASQRSRLRQSRSNLTRPHKKPACPLQIGERFPSARESTVKLFTRKRRQADRFDELILLIAQHSKKGHDFVIEIVQRLHGRWRAIQQDGRRTRERFAIVMAVRQQRQEPIEMVELATIPAEHNALPAPRSGLGDGGHRNWRGLPWHTSYFLRKLAFLSGPRCHSCNTVAH